MKRTLANDIPYVVFPENCGPYLSIDETCLSRDEVFTFLTNKAAHGGKGVLVAMIGSVASADISEVLCTGIPLNIRMKVKEVTSDLSSAMMESVRASFPHSILVNDRFHVQQLFNEAMDDVRIDIRHEVRRQEAAEQELCRENGADFIPMKYKNKETMPQILLRTKQALMQSKEKWSPKQAERMEILFEYHPIMKKTYELMQDLRRIFNQKVSYTQGGLLLAKWYESVAAIGRESFNTVVRTFKNNTISILNYFRRRATNASAESFNAKVKLFRAQLRGITDQTFFVFRLCKIFA